MMSASSFHASATPNIRKRPFPSHEQLQQQQCKPPGYLLPNHHYSNYSPVPEPQQHLNLDFNDLVYRQIFADMSAIVDDNCSSCCDNDNCVDKCENDECCGDCPDECSIEAVAHCSLDDCKVVSASPSSVSASSCPGSPCAQMAGAACQTVLCEDEVCPVDPCGVACVETVYCHDTACREEECLTLPCEVPCFVSGCSQAICREYSCRAGKSPPATAVRESSPAASYHGGVDAHNYVSFHVNNANSNRWQKPAPRCTETGHYASIAPNSLTLDTMHLPPFNALSGDQLYSGGGGGVVPSVPRWFEETETPLLQQPSKRRKISELTPVATPAFDHSYSTTPSSTAPTPMSSNLGDIDCLWDHGCDETFFDNLALQDHIQHAHIQYGTQQLDTLTCLWDGCGQETPDPNSLLDHVKFYHAPPPSKLICMWEGCRAIANSEAELQSHINAAHLPFGPQCKWDTCGLLAPDLEKHVQTQHLVPHVGKSPDTVARTCQWQDTDRDGNVHTCGMLFTSSTDLQQHAKEIHINALRKKTGYFCHWAGCNRMDKPFSQKGKVERHLQTHTGFKSCTCEECGKEFSAPQALQQHIRTHTGEKPYKCNFCGKEFAQGSAMTMHKRVHTGERPLMCTYPGCGKRFSESSNLSKHRKTHNPVGRHVCSFPGCDRSFHRLDQMKRHQKTHGVVISTNME